MRRAVVYTCHLTVYSKSGLYAMLPQTKQDKHKTPETWLWKSRQMDLG